MRGRKRSRSLSGAGQLNRWPSNIDRVGDTTPLPRSIGLRPPGHGCSDCSGARLLASRRISDAECLYITQARFAHSGAREFGSLPFYGELLGTGADVWLGTVVECLF